ncbi:hypothetical protein BKA93DRAFT_801152 [Sparassis latifolia]
MPDSATPARSVSRGREVYHSSGRGGLGNIRPASQDPASPSPSREPHDPDNFSPVRGREPSVKDTPLDRIVSTGRGGAGNIRATSRSMSRDPNAIEEEKYEASVIHASEEAARAGVYHSGRGGVGNIHPHSPSPAAYPPSSYPTSLPKSESRSRSRPPLHSTGRGGAGNLRTGAVADSEVAEVADIEEAERARKAHGEGV